MPRIRFTVSRTVKDGTDTHFHAGEVYDLPPDSVAHWLRRRVAELVEDSETGFASLHGRIRNELAAIGIADADALVERASTPEGRAELIGCWGINESNIDEVVTSAID